MKLISPFMCWRVTTHCISDTHEPDNAQSDAAAMTLTQLRYFAAIADSGLNITLAAERVHATQPGLSKQLKQLEDELGFLLFARKGRSLDSITPAGAQVLAHARRLLAEASNIRSYAANQRRDGQGRLVLATTHTQARFVLPPAIAKVKQAYPQRQRAPAAQLAKAKCSSCSPAAKPTSR